MQRRLYKLMTMLPSTVVAVRGAKQVGALSSAESGQTGCVVQSLPPVFVFPHVHFKDNFIPDGPPGRIGTAHPMGG